MKTFFLLALPTALLAADTAVPSGMINPIVNLGAVAALGCLVICYTMKSNKR